MRRIQLTVLMPVYNAGRYLSEAIQSILAQTYREFELLIINDGSIDDSAAVINSFNDPRIRLIHNDGNLGLIATLNKGLDLAQTRYVARMDADDISRPERLATQMRAMTQSRGNIIACGASMEKIGAKRGALVNPARHEDIYCGLLFTPTLAHPTIFFDRDSMRDGDFYYDSQYVHAEDYELWIRLGLNYRLLNVPEVLHYYRVHDGQVSHLHSETQLRNSMRIQKTMLSRIGFVPTPEELELHSTFFTRETRRGLDYAIAAGRWFDKILAANDKSQHFERASLLKYLSHKWFYLSYSNAGLGRRIWNLYRSKEYGGSLSAVSAANRRKLAIRSHLKWQPGECAGR